jgi:phospholipid/cholesterol/gamma-HCH transport system substrate-binding protein
METRANYVLVGTFVVIITIGVFAMVMWLGVAQFGAERGYAYDIHFPGAVTGLVKDVPVLENGVPIGRVSKIDLNPERPDEVVVTIEVRSQYRLKADATAALESNLVTNTSYIQIAGGTPGVGWAEPMEAGKNPQIPVRETGFQALAASLPEVLSRINTVGDHLNQLLNEENRSAITDTLENLRSVTGHMDEIFNDQNRSAIAAILQNAQTVTNKLSGTMDDARRTLLLADNVLGDVSGTAKQMNTLVQHVDALAQEIRPGLRDFTQSGLNDLHALISDARTLVAGFTRVAAELERDPTRFFFGEKREGYKPK